MSDNIIGAKIVNVRPMTDAELEREYWNPSMGAVPTAIELDTGAVLYPSRDGEGNGPGVMFGTDSDGNQIMLLPETGDEQ